ncbi:MAG: WecB/TagA/CpsF family glycosyltransferase [Clostridia bacterium]|nr:WecB/TagA/CpsF family glycosyltransferase [Clostridia bacterium]
MTKINIRGIYFDNIDMHEALVLAENAMTGETIKTVFTPNAEIAQLAAEQKEIKNLLNRADILLPDGAGVVLASKILKTPLKEKVAGVEFGENILALAAEKGYPVYFLGGKPTVAELAAQKMKEKYPALSIVGMHDGYFLKNGAENDAIIRNINESGAKILFVCLGAPAQEQWIDANKNRFVSVRLVMGLGGSLDVYAGTVRRAPKIFIRMHLEWFYRLCKEPRRIGRMMKLPKYIIGTVKDSRR